MNGISQDVYETELKKIAQSEEEQLRGRVYQKVYEFVIRHTDSPNDHESFINELVDECLNQVKERL